MSEKITITTKDGTTKGIKEWLEDKEEKKKEKKEKKESKKFQKIQEKEVIKQRKCLKRRVFKNGISPEYKEEHSEVRFLTNEEIIKEYKMPVKEGTISERGNTIRELVGFLQELEGRKVSTDVVVKRIKKPVKSISSFLSQLFNAGIVVRARMKDHKRKFVWGIAIPYKNGELEAIISLFNDFTAQRRRNAYQKKKEKGLSEGEEDINYHSKEELKEEKKIDKYLEEDEVEKAETDWKERMNKEYMKDVRKQVIEESGEHTLKIVVEGNIKILFGLAK